MSTPTVIKCLTTLFSLFGMPAYVHSDRGASFMSQELREFLSSKGVSTSRTTSYNPTCNGQVERYNGTELLIICGDVDVNPGPVSKRKQARSTAPTCPVCEKAVAKNHKRFICWICHDMMHVKCSNSMADFRTFSASSPLSWTCYRCTFASLPFLNDSSQDSHFGVLEGEGDSSLLSSLSPTPVEWYKENIKGYYKKNLSIGHLNTNSIIGKIDEIFDLLNECRFDILFISEMKIDKSVSTELLSNPHYRVIRNDRKRGAGGLLAYIHNSLTARRQLKLEPTGVESICLNVKGNTNTWFFVCACYRSPSECKVTDFISACSTAAEKMLKIRNEIVFIGDFNIDIMDYVDGNVHNTNNPLADFCDRYCLSNTITEPKRFTNTSETLIDVILVNRTERWTKSGTLKLGISDHDLVYIVRKPRLPKSKVQTIESRNMKKFNEASFCCDLSTAPWDSAFVYDDINYVWNHWSEF